VSEFKNVFTYIYKYFLSLGCGVVYNRLNLKLHKTKLRRSMCVWTVFFYSKVAWCNWWPEVHTRPELNYHQAKLFVNTLLQTHLFSWIGGIWKKCDYLVCFFTRGIQVIRMVFIHIKTVSLVARIAGSNPAQRMDVCICVYMLCCSVSVEAFATS
jgi:hypothetical protein